MIKKIYHLLIFFSEFKIIFQNTGLFNKTLNFFQTVNLILFYRPANYTYKMKNKTYRSKRHSVFFALYDNTFTILSWKLYDKSRSWRIRKKAFVFAGILATVVISVLQSVMLELILLFCFDIIEDHEQGNNLERAWAQYRCLRAAVIWLLALCV